MKRAVFGLICYLGCVFAQEYCDLGPNSRALIGTRQGEGIGYKEGYSSARVFLTPNWSKSFQPFLDARGHIFNDGYYAGNVGIGARYLSFWNWAFGANLYYDFRTVEKLNPSQIGSGIEVLSRHVDFRINGYFPVADTERKGPARIKTVQGNQIIVRRHLAAAYTALNGEMGLPIGGFFEPINLYIALGPYYLFRKEIDQFNFGNAFGGQVRVNARILDGFDIGGNFSYDRLFHGRINGYVTFSFPFGPSTLKYKGERWKRRYSEPNCADAAWRQRILAQDVVRHEIIPIKTVTLKGAGVDPLNGHPLSVVFVSNLSVWAGDGTFEAPFESLALAEEHSKPNQIIYLLSGNPYEDTITLKPGQSLQGSGKPMAIEDTYYPAYTTNGPVIISPDAPAITLSETNSVVGVTIEALQTWAIDARSANEAIIQEVHFNGGNLGGIVFDGAKPGIKAVEKCLFSNFAKDAIAISAKDLVASEVRIRDNHIHSLDTAVAFSGPSIFHIHANQFAGVKNGIIGSLDHGRSYAIISQNDIATSAVGIGFDSTSIGIGQLQIEHNRIHARDLFNDALLLRAGRQQKSGAIEAFVSSNSLHGADGVFKVQNKGSHILLRLEGNWSNCNYALINYENNPKLFNVDALNKEESGVEDLNQAGNVLVPFESVHFRPYEKGPRFFTPFEGFEEDRL